ncbi:NAD(P)/FAD-dependent oxidoreductase [Gordonia sp. FQ]|uniref:NAD(P)/FAD-dependent oxidoreductase n=1 Tax=Gordonia sp. FQ TaxID=3446634 RepID=UPI003F828579
MTKTVPEKAAVVVIGGGVIGTSIAFHLAESGVHDVVLLEKDELGSGSTCRAAGGVRATFSNASNIAIGLRGLDVYSRFAQLYGHDADFERNGYLFLLSDQAMVDVFTESVALQNAHGVPTRMIDPDEAKRLSPLIETDGLLAASWSPDDGRCTPEAIVAGYAAAARRHGAAIVRHCGVTGVDPRAGGGYEVVTPHGVISADTIVIAAGAWSGQIGDMIGVDIPVTPYRRQIAFTEPIPGLPARMPSLTIDFPSALYFEPERDGLLIGWADPAQEPGFNLRFELDDWLMKVGEIAQVRVPVILESGIVSGWAGLYEVTPDDNQIIDRVRDDVLVATGYSGHGFLMGPATGEIIRDLYHGREPGYDIADFRLDRFAPDRLRGETNIV